MFQTPYQDRLLCKFTGANLAAVSTVTQPVQRALKYVVSRIMITGYTGETIVTSLAGNFSTEEGNLADLTSINTTLVNSAEVFIYADPASSASLTNGNTTRTGQTITLNITNPNDYVGTVDIYVFGYVLDSGDTIVNP